MSDLETTLKRAILNLRFGGLDREEDVKIAVILPILNALDWHSADPGSLRPEYPAGPGRVDYALLCHGRPQVFVEAKRRGAVDARAEAQLFGYAAHNGVPLLVLSDGLFWDFYLSMADGRPEERRFDRLELRDEDSVPKYAKTLESCLRKLKVASGEARRDAESLLEDDRSRNRARIAMPDAWNALLNGPDELLCDLLADKVQARTGAKPRPADIEEFLLRLPVARPSSTPEEQPTRQYRSAVTEEPREKPAKADELQFGESRKAARDYTKYDIYIDGEYFPAQNKRWMMFQIVSRILVNGGTPQQVIDAIPWRKGLFKELEGELTAEQACQVIMEKSVDRARRYFCGDGQVFAVGGKTYALTNQWGKQAEDAARKLADAFPDLKIEVNPTASS